jgi:hypothetical protein
MGYAKDLSGTPNYSTGRFWALSKECGQLHDGRGGLSRARPVRSLIQFIPRPATEKTTIPYISAIYISVRLET